MRKQFYLYYLLTAGFIVNLFCTCSVHKETVTKDKGVVINGVRWATRNVDNFGTFAPTPESAGKFYQWNRKKAWNTTDKEVEGWVKSKLDFYFDLYIKGLSSDSDTIDRPCSYYWEKQNNPCPKGWNIPDDEDFETLLDEDKVTYEWVTYNGIEGAKFTDKKTGKSIFLPAVGSRDGDRDSGALDEGWGNYWSNMWGNDCEAYALDFGSQDVIKLRTAIQSSGNNIRPVAYNNNQKKIEYKFKQLSYGHYKYDKDSDSGVKLIKKTNKIPAEELEELFGVEVSLVSKTYDRGIVIDGIAVKCIFPKTIVDSEGNKFKEITKTYMVPANIPQFYSIYDFDEEFDIVKGEWILQMFYKNKKVLEQKFLVK